MPSSLPPHPNSLNSSAKAGGTGILSGGSPARLPRLPPLQSAIGMKFGRYTLLRRLAKGGMAEVWLAELPSPDGYGRKVALKHIHTELARRPEFIRLFQAEARLGVQLSHPNIVSTLEYGEEQGSWFLAMDYVEGASLGQLIRTCITKGKLLPLPVVLEIINQLCLGLQYAHTSVGFNGEPLQLVHRDLKPGNVLIDRYGTVKLTDFGIARATVQVSPASGSMLLQGTPAYMAPEQAQGLDQLDARADLYALGLLFFELLSNQRLHLDAESVTGLDNIRQGRVSHRLLLLNGRVPPLISSVLAKLLARNPAERFGSAEALQQLLQPLLNRAQAQLSRSAKGVLGELVAWVERAEQGRHSPTGATLSTTGSRAARLGKTDPAPSCLEEPGTMLEATVVQDRLDTKPTVPDESLSSARPSVQLIDPAEERTIIAEMTRASLPPGQPPHPPAGIPTRRPSSEAQGEETVAATAGRADAALRPPPEPSVSVALEDSSETDAALADLLAGLHRQSLYQIASSPRMAGASRGTWSAPSPEPWVAPRQLVSAPPAPGGRPAAMPLQTLQQPLEPIPAAVVLPSERIYELSSDVAAPPANLRHELSPQSLRMLASLTPRQALMLGGLAGMLMLIVLAGAKLLLRTW